jgi:hypothetical protein
MTKPDNADTPTTRTFTRTEGLNLLMEVCPLPVTGLTNHALVAAALSAAVVDNGQRWQYEDVLAAAVAFNDVDVERIFRDYHPDAYTD